MSPLVLSWTIFGREGMRLLSIILSGPQMISFFLAPELWSIIHGLTIAWTRGFRHILVYSDSKTTVCLLFEGCCRTNACHALVTAIHEVHNRSGDIAWKHTYREANQMADALAKLGLSLDNPIRILIILLFLFLILLKHMLVLFVFLEDSSLLFLGGLTPLCSSKILLEHCSNSLKKEKKSKDTVWKGHNFWLVEH